MHEMSERLSGVSTQATIQTNGAAFTEDILFTHRGLSGPAALQASSYWEPGRDLSINLFPGMHLAGLLLQAKAANPQAVLRTLLAEHLPRSLVGELQALMWPKMADTRIGEWPDANLRALAHGLEDWLIRPAATEGYRTAEVTLGGVDTDELSSKTMECKQHSGLFFIGEVVDVSGQLGGFNFQWAWASAQAAALAI
jgi:predicted Rossmann fold flavoprotein